MLQREDRGGHQHQHLLALARGLERRPQRDLRLAVADVSADEAVHRPRRLHVGLDELDRLALVGSLAEGETLLELPLPLAVGRERVPPPASPLRVQAQQLARQLLRGAARARLHRLPARAPELAQRRVLAARAHIARDLGELVGGHEHTVVALVFQVQVVASNTGDRSRLKAREARDPVVLVHDDVAAAKLAERAQCAPARSDPPPGDSVAPPACRRVAQQAVLGKDRELQRRGDEALAQRGGGQPQGRPGGRAGIAPCPGSILGLIQPARAEAAQVVCRAFAFPAARERDHRLIARAHQLFKLWLGLRERARRAVCSLRAQLVRLIARDR